MVIPKAFFSKGMGAFCRKSGGKPKESMPFPVSLSSRPSSFRAQREIFLAQRSNGERQMRSSRSTHAILSLPHKYRVPLRRKRSRAPLGMTIREAGYLTWLFIRSRRRLPLRGSLSSAFGAPLLQGATQRSCKNADPSQGRLPHIVISSEARNLCYSRFSGRCVESQERETCYQLNLEP